MGKKNNEKFSFGTDFQELILQYTVTDKKGYKTLELYDDTYFTLTQHSIIAFALKKYYKKYKKVPNLASLKESIRVLYTSDRRLFEPLTEEDRQEITHIASNLYKEPVPNSEEIVAKCVSFARYVRFKTELEKVDINQYDSYEAALANLTQAIRVGFDLEQDMGIRVIGGISDRAYKRDQVGVAHPTPFWQLDRLLNSNGFIDSPVIMLVAEAKRFKTGALINVAIGYLKRKKKVIYFDLENGEHQLTIRSEQSIVNAEQSEISSGDMDPKLLKVLRRYKRIGAELIIKRMPAYSTTTDDLQAIVDLYKTEHGIRFDACIIDYGDLLASLSGKKEEFDRISDSYVDIKNFSKFNSFESTWTASHVVREAAKRRSTVYTQNDLAKCIDKIRHVDMAIGLQESDEEIENKVLRWEIIEQRNGAQFGRCLFWMDIAKQRMREFTRKQVREYESQVKEEKPKKRKTDLDE